MSRDIYQRFINPTVSDTRLMLVSRVSMAILSVIAFFGVTYQEVVSMAIINAFVFASSFWAAWLPPLLGGLLFKRTTESGAFWGMLSGVALALIIGLMQITKVKPAWIPAPIIVSIVTSILVTWLVSLATSPKAGEAEFFAQSRPVPVKG